MSSNEWRSRLEILAHDGKGAVDTLGYGQDIRAALDRIAKLEAVVAVARACYWEDDFVSVTEPGDGAHLRDDRLRAALDALDGVDAP